MCATTRRRAKLSVSPTIFGSSASTVVTILVARLPKPAAHGLRFLGYPVIERTAVRIPRQHRIAKAVGQSSAPTVTGWQCCRRDGPPVERSRVRTVLGGLGTPRPRDVFAGLVTGLFSIPEGMAYASIGGFNPVAGLYSGMVSTIARLGVRPHRADGDDADQRAGPVVAQRADRGRPRPRRTRRTSRRSPWSSAS